MRLPWPSLVVLIGPSGSGKSTWAAAHLRPEQVVASDDLRALVGEGRHDQRAGQAAFEVLDLVLRRRMERRLFTVVDTLGFDARRRRAWVELAHAHGLSCHAIVFDTADPLCRARNKQRPHPVPAKVLTEQLRARELLTIDQLQAEGFDAIHGDAQTAGAELVPASMIDTPTAARRQEDDPVSLRFGLQLPRFTWPGGPSELGPRLASIAGAAEEAGFESIWVMDHFHQIPQVGRPWEDMLDSWTTLAFLAAHTNAVRLGPLVSGITYRNIGHLGKIAATLDVLSGGRVVCGVGAAWYEAEHTAYGWSFPPLAERYARLEDALVALPALWGPGNKPFHGKTTTLADTTCYPRPIQEHLPILVGGSGERRTLKLVAQHADACNLFGDPATVRHKLDVLGQHCAAAGRDPASIEVTHLSTALVGRDRKSLMAMVEALRPPAASPEAYAAASGAATIDEQVGRYRQLADAGVQTAIVSLPDVASDDAMDRFSKVIDAFR